VNGPGYGHARNAQFSGDGSKAFALLIQGHGNFRINFGVRVAAVDTSGSDLNHGRGLEDGMNADAIHVEVREVVIPKWESFQGMDEFFEPQGAFFVEVLPEMAPWMSKAAGVAGIILPKPISARFVIDPQSQNRLLPV
jgi:hypothetical protein